MWVPAANNITVYKMKHHVCISFIIFKQYFDLFYDATEDAFSYIYIPYIPKRSHLNRGKNVFMVCCNIIGNYRPCVCNNIQCCVMYVYRVHTHICRKYIEDK